MTLNIKLPETFMGKNCKEAYERVMSGEYEKKEETQKSFDKKPDTNDFIYVPSINLYVAKERTHLGKNWFDSHKLLQEQGNRMLIIPEFIEFLKYTKENYKDIYNEITEVRNPWRAEWLDANFKKRKNGLYILTENETKEEKLEDCLMENKIIDLNDWINKNYTKQGLPNKNIKSGSLYYWKPRNNNNLVVRFDASVDRAYLVCYWYPSYTYSSLGVRRCKAGLA